MGAEIKILVEGYTTAESSIKGEEERTQATITLVEDGNVIMVVDPGILESQQILVDALQKENLTVEDVNFVCVTHSHFDHYGNVGIFPKATILEFFGLWKGNTAQDWKEQFSDNIKVIKTPGHDYTDITLLVTTGSESSHPGTVAICGDVFWKENLPKNPEDDIYVSDHEKLKESRKKVLELADWVIPGHAGIYKPVKN